MLAPLATFLLSTGALSTSASPACSVGELRDTLQGLAWLRHVSEPAFLWTQCEATEDTTESAQPLSRSRHGIHLPRVALQLSRRNRSASLRACQCFKKLRENWVQSRRMEREMLASLRYDAQALRNLSFQIAGPALPGRALKELRPIFHHSLGQMQMAMWQKAHAMLTLVDEDAGYVLEDVGHGKNVEDFIDGIFKSLRAARHQIWQFLYDAGNACLPNVFRMDCGSAHEPIFERFPPVQGPALEGQVMDFLGISTTFRAACGDLDEIGEPHLFQAPGRSLECLYARAGKPLRNWPILDEEYLEWADVLTSAAAAASRPRAGLRVAEIGAGRFGIWGVRAAKAFLRLAPETSCDILLVEPFDLGDGSDMRRHMLHNLPDGRCKVELKTDPVYTAKDLRSLLSTHSAKWDLVDIDAQGAERGLLQGLAGWLAGRVHRLHVSTHTRSIHKEIRRWLLDAGWTILAESWWYSRAEPLKRLGPFVTVDGHISAVP